MRRAYFEGLIDEAPTAKVLEAMALKANQITQRHFGKTVSLYTPLYLSNHCENHCVYCGFQKGASIKRAQLDTQQIKEELMAIYATGIREVLLLTGESPKSVPLSYLKTAIKCAKDIGFKSIALEVYPMSTEAYGELVCAGANALTLYQETYNRDRYKSLHLSGPKSDFDYRYEAPYRAAQAGFKQITIGPLYGLSALREEALATFDHLSDLEKKYPHVEWGIALPRLRDVHTAHTFETYACSDKAFVQLFTAFRMAFERASMSLSTRESFDFRKNMLPLGVTKLSAGVLTTVGGYSKKENQSTPQFQISDGSSVSDIAKMLISMGYQPIYSDWVPLGL